MSSNQISSYWSFFWHFNGFNRRIPSLQCFAELLPQSTVKSQDGLTSSEQYTIVFHWDSHSKTRSHWGRTTRTCSGNISLRDLCISQKPNKFEASPASFMILIRTDLHQVIVSIYTIFLWCSTVNVRTCVSWWWAHACSTRYLSVQFAIKVRLNFDLKLNSRWI